MITIEILPITREPRTPELIAMLENMRRYAPLPGDWPDQFIEIIARNVREIAKLTGLPRHLISAGPRL